MRFEYHPPDSLEATIGLLTRYGPEAALLAGSMARMNLR